MTHQKGQTGPVGSMAGSPMTYERFREIWDKTGFTFECSQHLGAALVKAANGDHKDFDEIERLLANTGDQPRADDGLPPKK